MFRYAGVGSRRAPELVLRTLTEISRGLRALGWRLSSGGADGADTAFEAGAGNDKEIFLATAKDIPQAAFEIAERYHPAWSACTPYVRCLMARNSQILLGRDCLEPVNAVICWTDSPERGGTSQGIRIARAYEIPVFNTYDAAFSGSAASVIEAITKTIKES